MKTDVHAFYLALNDYRVPWYAKVLLALIIGYVLCSIDLISEFFSVLGQIDVLIIVPAGISIVFKMNPPMLWTIADEKPELNWLTRKRNGLSKRSLGSSIYLRGT